MNEIQIREMGEIVTASPPDKKEAPAGRHGAISGEETNEKYRLFQLEAIRFARIALSLSELEEWIHSTEVSHEA
jgi:hypothetical protein